MITVIHDVASVESRLIGGCLLCPGCAGRLRPWGWARERSVRDGIGVDRVVLRLRPRRARCSTCSGTHVLLDARLPARRADSARVIAEAIELKIVHGLGHRVIAGRLGRPVSTVRGWLRSFAAAAVHISNRFAVLVHRDAVDAAATWPVPTSVAAGRALSALMSYAEAVGRRLGIGAVAWQGAGLNATGGRLFSAGFWANAVQHELALMPAVVVPEL